MGTVSGQGTTYNLPNFVGELFALSREDTPFLSAIGGLSGGVPTNTTHFTWQTYDLRDAEDDRQALEGANAPQPSERSRSNGFNVVEIHHEAVEVSYTKQATSQQVVGIGTNHPQIDSVPGTNPVTNELDWQVEQALKQIARDINASFITGTFVDPGTNGSARATRGLLQAISTNAISDGGDLADPQQELILDLMQMIYDNGGIREGETRTLLCGSTQKRRITKYFKAKNYEVVPASRNVGGVNVTSVETDFGNLNIMLEPAVPSTTVVVASLGECRARFLEIPGKGLLFVEDLAKQGASERKQLYCEVGLEYGLEKHHGKLTNLDDGTS